MNHHIKAFFVEIADDRWMDRPKYEKSLGNEALQELCTFYNKKILERSKAVDILCDIIEKLPECGKLFAAYKVKEALLAEAYRDKNFDRAEKIRSGEIKPDITGLLQKAESLKHAREKSIALRSCAINEIPK